MARSGAVKPGLKIEATRDSMNAAGVVADAIAGESTKGVALSFADGTTVALPPALVDMVLAAAGVLAGGGAVTVLPADTVLSPAEAAGLLGLSRPFVVRLLDDGVIPSQRLPRSRHRRVRLADVVEFAAQREERREGRRRVGAILNDASLPY
jgi:excisionase family DNA binding protein